MTEALQNLNTAIGALEKLGVKKGEPDMKNGSWGWGVDGITGKRMEPVPFCGVFLHHITSFKNQLDKVDGKLVLLSDCCDHTTLSDGSEYEVTDDIEDEEEEKTIPCIVTYYRSRVKGLMKVASFEDAMYVFMEEKLAGLEHADRWLKLAMQMHDSPAYLPQSQTQSQTK